MTSPRIVVFGGTGFVGTVLVPRLVQHGYRVIVPSRNRNRHRTLNTLPEVRVVDADMYSDTDLRKLLDGAHAAINLVGILNEKGRNGRGFYHAHVTLTDKITRACRAVGTRRLLQMSALNAGRGDSFYLRTRGEAEALVKASGLNWTLFQPSMIFGPGDNLFHRFAQLLRYLPVLPVARAHTKLAPVYVGDVAEAFLRALNDPSSTATVYELYGPHTLTLQALIEYTAACLKLRRVMVPLPDVLGRLQATLMDFIPGKPFSIDNFRSLKLDSVGGIDGLCRLGIDRTPMDDIVPIQLGLQTRQRRYDTYRRTRPS